MEWNKVEHDPETGRVEGLPEEAGEYIFSFSNGTVAVDEIIYDYYGVFLDAGDIYSVTAWMPMPEPYKEEGDNKLKLAMRAGAFAIRNSKLCPVGDFVHGNEKIPWIEAEKILLCTAEGFDPDECELKHE